MSTVQTPLGPAIASRLHDLMLRIAVLASGAILMALEILAFRIIGKTFGSALRETSIVIAIFLAAMSLGYYAGGRIVDRYPRMRTFSLLLLAAALSMSVVPALDTAVSERVFNSGLPLGLHAFVVTLVLFFVPTFFLATASPVGVRLLADRVEHTGTVAGSLSAISTVGSIAGSLGTAFILIDAFQSVQRTIYALSLVAFVLVIVILLVSDAAALATSASRRATVATALAGALVICGFLALNPLGARVLHATSQRIVFERDSAYHHIRVVDSSLRRTLYFDATPQSEMNLDDWQSGGFAYTDLFHLPKVLAPSTKRVLFVGIGGGTGPKAYARYYPDVDVDAVDVDPAVIDVAKRFFGLRTGSRLQTYALDGRAFVKRTANRYDAILVDAYTQNRYGVTIPAHLTTVEFFDECNAKLTGDGVVIFNSAFGKRGRLTAAVARSMLRVFPYQAVFSEGNSVIVGSNKPLPSTREEWIKLAAGAPHDIQGQLQLRVAALESLNVGGAPILTDDYSPVDQLARDAR